ncbi:MAG: glycosyltransferase [Nitrososphaerales archaeon]
MKISAIVATLSRPSLQDLLVSLREQTLPRSEWQLLTWTGEINEYAARNEAAKVARGDVLAFVDDDCQASPKWLENGLRYFDKNWELKILTGPVEGDMWGNGQPFRLSKPCWFIGCNIMVRKDAFLDVGGFEVDWGLNPAPRGWRGDSDLGWRMIQKFGEACYKHAEDVEIIHPKQMMSTWDPRVEVLFYFRHKKRIFEHFVPVDPRICYVILAVEEDRELRQRARRQLSEFGINDENVRKNVESLVNSYVPQYAPLRARREAHQQRARLDYIVRNAVEPILDVGAGDGLTFFDTAKEHVNLDVDRYQTSDFVQSNAVLLPFQDGSFETVTIGEILEHIADPTELLREALRVARSLVVITTPDEQKWDASKSPLITREQRMKQDGFRDVDSMQKNFTGVNPLMVELIPESKFRHAWHVNWFTQKSLTDLFKEFKVGYEIGEVAENGFVWFAATLWKINKPDLKENRA